MRIALIRNLICAELTLCWKNSRFENTLSRLHAYRTRKSFLDVIGGKGKIREEYDCRHLRVVARKVLRSTDTCVKSGGSVA